MPEPADYPQPESEGGPVKSFLEHLEDLRWTLIKCAAAITVGFAICAFAAKTLVGLLLWPLERAPIGTPPASDIAATVALGTNYLGRFVFATNQIGDFRFPTNHITIELVPVGTNYLLSFRLLGSTAAAAVKPPIPVQIMNFSPAGGFMVAVQMAFYGGVVLASPFLLYFIGQFVLPALKKTEKRMVIRSLAIGTLLFLTGASFCYFFLLPMVLGISYQYSAWLGFSAAQWRAEEYISFVCRFMLGMGIGFEEPLVLLTLVRIGILSVAGLKKFRPYMVVINLVLGAVLTTPEVVTQITLFIPLQLLYEISILVATAWERKERQREKTLYNS